MKDNFSIQASSYAQFRPDYPDEIIHWILQFVEKRGLALDVATGNGQVAGKLAQFFGKVFASDISERQIAKAAPRANIVYRIGTAENTGFSDDSFDLITVA